MASGKEHDRRVLPLSRAWDAAQHLLKHAADHVRMAWLRELQVARTRLRRPAGCSVSRPLSKSARCVSQAAATPYRVDVAPPLRATTPMEFQVIDLDHFLLSAAVFFDFSTQLAADQHKGSGSASSGTPIAERRKQGSGKGGTLIDYPLAASLLAVLRRSVLLSEGVADASSGAMPESVLGTAGALPSTPA